MQIPYICTISWENPVAMISEIHGHEFVRSLFQNRGYAYEQIKGYEEFMFEILPSILHENTDINIESGNTTHTISFINMRITKPSLKEYNGVVRSVFPIECHQRNLNYSNTILIDVEHVFTKYAGDNRKDIIARHSMIYKEVPFFKIPCCVGSKLCNTYQSDDRGLCALDNGGYFICNGNDKVMISQIKLRTNKIYIFKSKASSKFAYKAEVRSAHNKWRSTSTLTVHVDEKGTNIVSHIPFIFKNKSLLDVDILVLFKLMLSGNDHECTMEDIMGVVFPKTLVVDANMESVKDFVETIFQNNVHKTWSYAECIKLLLNTSTERTLEKKKVYIHHIVSNEILPHIRDRSHDTCSDDVNVNFKKAIFVGNMVRKVVQVFLGQQSHSDRDSFRNKKLDTTGPLIAVLFRQLFRNTLKTMRSSIKKTIEKKNYLNVMDFINERKLTSALLYHWGTGSWSLSRTNNVKTGVVQLYSRVNFMASMSHMTRCNTPINKDGKCLKPRMLNLSQWALLCAAESPEGSAVGLVNNRSILCSVTTADFSSLIIQTLSSMKDVHVTPPGGRLTDVSAITINGDPTLYVLPENVQRVYKQILKYKVQNIIQRDCSILLSKIHGGIDIYSDPGRMVRCVFKKEGLNKASHIISSNMGTKDGVRMIMFLLQEQGCIEWICKSYEMDECCIALSLEDFLRNPDKYTHLEITQSSIFGITASCQVFCQNNQSPRNIYQCSMGKQSLGISVTNFRDRFDMHMFMLNHFTRPLTTSIYENISNPLPTGIPSVVAIACSGNNQEDSLILNQFCIDRGFAHLTYYRCFSDEIDMKKCESDASRFEKPDHTCHNRKNANYSLLNEHGFVPIGTRVGKGDVIIGRTSVVSMNGKRVRKCSSTVLESDSYAGVVDDVLFTTTSDNHKLIKMKIRITRVPEIADKFSSRHGQKGTVGFINKTADSIFCSKTGLVPDIIINPHAIPSRMTCGQMIESLLNVSACMNGMEGNGTSFKNISIEKIGDELKKHGFNENGVEDYRCGKTGKKLKMKIYTGIVNYQRLRHMVSDKIHSRSTGVRSLISRQPLEGRSRGGGLRVGEMERDAILGHGCSHFLLDRLMLNSDVYRMYVCSKCGNPAIPPSRLVSDASKRAHAKCSNSSCDGTCVSVKIPYASKVFFNEIQGLHVGARFRV